MFLEEGGQRAGPEGDSLYPLYLHSGRRHRLRRPFRHLPRLPHLRLVRVWVRGAEPGAGAGALVLPPAMMLGWGLVTLAFIHLTIYLLYI